MKKKEQINLSHLQKIMKETSKKKESCITTHSLSRMRKARKQFAGHEPFVNEDKQKKHILSNLQRNLESLKALRDEYLAEEAKRRQLNKNLDEAGFTTMREKLDAMVAQGKQDVDDYIEFCEGEKLTEQFADNWGLNGDAPILTEIQDTPVQAVHEEENQ